MTERTGQNPDPADPEFLHHTVAQQRTFLELHSNAISRMSSIQEDLNSRINGISRILQEVTEQNSNPTFTTSQLSSGNITTSAMTPEDFRLQPEPFRGDVEACGGFLLQCQLLFQRAPSKALQWAQAFLASNPITPSFDHFIEEFRLVFDQPRKQEEATRKLLALRQRNRSLSEHVIDFRILAVQAGWSDPALRGVFYQTLNESIKDHLCTQPEANSFEDLVAAALRSDIRLRERNHDRISKTRPEPSRRTSDEPIQIGHSKLSAEERLRRRNEGACFYCGELGHQVIQCSLRSNYRAPPLGDRPRGEISTMINDFLFVPVKLCHLSKVLDLQALIDSGVEQSLIDHSIVNSLSLPTERLTSPVKAAGLGGQHLSLITHRTKPILLVTSGNHRETIQFFITRTPQTPVVLGFTWLKLHNPQLDWSRHSITSWSDFCMGNCLQSALPSVSTPNVYESETIDLSNIPECYHDLKLVFSKSKAASLPPHRPYDCAINLLDGAPLPKGRLFNLSGPEKAAMEQYIQDALSLGHIRPSSSPAGAGFFFVEKKDKSLRPCIDYRELNQITIKDKYSLPLISSVFDSIQEARIFSKLDLRNAYHLVRMKEGDEWKTAFNTPVGHYEYLVMPFVCSTLCVMHQAWQMPPPMTCRPGRPPTSPISKTATAFIR
uniref:ribonuclease H n=1 Tax=Oryzias latipes TaxID=8090 RepID=A0A3B3I3Y3_ORYLA